MRGTSVFRYFHPPILQQIHRYFQDITSQPISTPFFPRLYIDCRAALLPPVLRQPAPSQATRASSSWLPTGFAAPPIAATHTEYYAEYAIWPPRQRFASPAALQARFSHFRLIRIFDRPDTAGRLRFLPGLRKISITPRRLPPRRRPPSESPAEGCAAFSG